jgi:hypothetical protein
VDDLLALLSMVLWHRGSQGGTLSEHPSFLAATADALRSMTSPRPGNSPATHLSPLSFGGSMDSADTMPRTLLRVGQDGAVRHYMEGTDLLQDSDAVVPLYWPGNDCCGGTQESKTACLKEGYSFGETGTMTLSVDLSVSRLQTAE